MVFKKITNKDIKEMCDWLEFYDKFGYLPFKKRRIDVYLSNATIHKLKDLSKERNKSVSAIIEDAI